MLCNILNIVAIIKECGRTANKTNIRLKRVASVCDQCMWAVGMVAGHNH